MENEDFDLEKKPTLNKDVWLFLIVLDIICICVFGFFLYKHFSVKLFQAPSIVAVSEAIETEEVVLPEETVDEKPLVKSVAAEPEAPVAATKETTVAAILETAPAKQVVKEEAPAPQETKQSIFVENIAKSKYRKVTFRWYGEGKNVAIVSGFTMTKPKALTKKDGYWETTLSISPGTYKFLYVIDGQNKTDPYAPEKDGRSVLDLK